MLTKIVRLSSSDPCSSEFIFIRVHLYLALERDLYRARERYLDEKLSVWDAHSNVPYLRALVALKRPTATREAVSWICFFLDASPSQSVVTILYDLVFDTGMELSPTLKETILMAMWRRISRKKLPTRLPLDGGGDNTHSSENDTDDFVFTSDGGASSLVQEVRQAVFFPFSMSPSGPGTPAEKAIWTWARHQAHLMFDARLPPSTRWRNLTLLASANSSAVNVPGDILDSESQTPIVSADFRVAAVLSILERLVSSYRDSDTGQIRLFVRGVWRLWYKAINPDHAVHPAKIRPIISSFLRLAAHTRDDYLRTQCLELADSGFYRFDLGDDFAKRQVQVLAANAMVASEACGSSGRWQDGLPNFVACEAWQDVLTRLAIPRLARLDAMRAYALHQHWRPHLEVTPDVAGPMAVGLVHAGRMDLALPFLSRCQFVGPRGQRILATVLRAVYEERNRFIDFGLAEVMAKAFKALYPALQPLRQLRRPISFVLIALVGAGHARTALGTFTNIRSGQASYFPPTFILAFLRCLCRNRQFRLAVKLVDDVGASSPPVDQQHIKALRRTLLLSLVRTGAGATRLAERFSNRNRDRTLATARNRALTLSFNLRRWMIKSSRVRGRPLPRPFKRSRAMLRLADRLKSSSFVFSGKARAGVLRGGDIFGLTPRMRTYLGNILIQECLVTRRRRERARDRLRNALETLDDLVRGSGRTSRMKMMGRGGDTGGQEKGEVMFVPDRVTMNIVLSGMLAWVKEWDSMKVRMLFDLLVRCGYPVGEKYARENVPFGSSPSSVDERVHGEVGRPYEVEPGAETETGVESSGGREETGQDQGVMDWVELLRRVTLSGEQIRFERHVRPMMKMFIKALYVRGDVVGARILVGILREVEMLENRERVARLQRRRRNRGVGNVGDVE